MRTKFIGNICKTTSFLLNGIAGNVLLNYVIDKKMKLNKLDEQYV